MTVQVFLRELRGIGSKADPPLSPLAMLAALDLGLLDEEVSGTGRSRVESMKALWQRVGACGTTFTDFESALVRLGRDCCRRQGGRVVPCANSAEEDDGALCPARGQSLRDRVQRRLRPLDLS